MCVFVKRRAKNHYLAKTKNNDWFGVGSQENKDAMAEYAKQMGLDQLNGYKISSHSAPEVTTFAGGFTFEFQ